MTFDGKRNGDGEKNRPGRVGKIAALALAGLMVGAGVAVVTAAFVLAPARSAHAGLPRVEFSNAEVRVAETESGNLVADALRAAAGAEIAFVPAAAFKNGATAPQPASADAAAGLVDPASDAVVTLNVRGDKVLEALERSVSFAPQPSGGFLQVSGIKFSYNAGKPSGSRVQGVTVGGQPLAAAKTYKVAMPRPLALGQQGYIQVWDRSERPSDTGKSIAAALADYAGGRGGSLNASVEGRINAAR
jgi:5'-nucleotidase / UDP-sugar diphosphatase